MVGVTLLRLKIVDNCKRPFLTVSLICRGGRLFFGGQVKRVTISDVA